MAKSDLICWKCGASLSEIKIPLSRLDACSACRAELHVCRFCSYYNKNYSRRCEQEMAEVPREADHANFCDYYSLNVNAYIDNEKSLNSDSKNKLNALFGESESETHCSELSANRKESSKSDSSKQKLEELFGTNNKKNSE